jgi:hypothetical protein
MMEKNNGSSIDKLVVISGRMKHPHTHKKKLKLKGCAKPHYLAKEDAKEEVSWRMTSL